MDRFSYGAYFADSRIAKSLKIVMQEVNALLDKCVKQKGTDTNGWNIIARNQNRFILPTGFFLLLI